ncbi:MAG: hypothetical protein KatS3mg031_1428 [Chitinophagales bacterium]|nr:MAG: hypothetical protein KatS3mg031_1428 [Chitinophagales bacterium]
MVFLLLPCLLVAQEMFPVNDISDKRPESFAFTHAVIHLDYQSTLNASTLLISKGKVVAAGNNVHIPPDAVVIDVRGAHIYPSFIDLFSDYGIQAPSMPAREERWSKARFESSRKGAYGWNEAIHPETRADELWRTDEKTAADYRKQGFGAVLTHLHDGIARGSGVLVTLGNRRENEEIVKGIASAHYAFDKGSSLQDYPTSLMGAIALLRQSYLDAQWYAASRGAVPYNISLDAWNRIQSVPQIFEVDDVLSFTKSRQNRQ